MKASVLTLSLLVPALGLFVVACSGARPSGLGVRDGRLAPCPISPNCVSSQSSNAEHAVAPLSFSGAIPDAQARLTQVLLGMKRVRIVTDTGDYIHAEFTSALFRFVDDVEFWFDAHAKVIQVRSASRLGKYDLGKNRKRVEEIRARWKEQVK